MDLGTGKQESTCSAGWSVFVFGSSHSADFAFPSPAILVHSTCEFSGNFPSFCNNKYNDSLEPNTTALVPGCRRLLGLWPHQNHSAKCPQSCLRLPLLDGTWNNQECSFCNYSTTQTPIHCNSPQTERHRVRRRMTENNGQRMNG